MFIKCLLIVPILLQLLHAQSTLKSVYYIDSDFITLETIIPDSDSNTTLFKIDRNRHTKRVSSKNLIKILKEHGYKGYTYKNSYVSFIKKSPIDTSRIESAVIEYYQQKYKNIDITDIHVEPRAYMSTIPDEYIVNIRDKDYLRRSGTINIKTPKNRKIFFNYNIEASVDVHVSRKNIKKDTELSLINLSKKRVILDKFRAKPIEEIQAGTFQSKHHIRKGKTVTLRDIEPLSVVRKNANINITMQSDNMNISFSAKALQNAQVNDIIRVQKSNGKVLKVRVTGKNRAEIE